MRTLPYHATQHLQRTSATNDKHNKNMSQSTTATNKKHHHQNMKTNRRQPAEMDRGHHGVAAPTISSANNNQHQQTLGNNSEHQPRTNGSHHKQHPTSVGSNCGKETFVNSSTLMWQLALKLGSHEVHLCAASSPCAVVAGHPLSCRLRR